MEKKQVNRAEKEYSDCSGKSFNVLRALRSLYRGPIDFIGFGSERDYSTWKRASENFNADLHWVETERDLRICHTLLDGSCTELVGANPVLSLEQVEFIQNKLLQLSGKASLIALSGSLNKAVKVNAFVDVLAESVRQNDSPLFVDISGDYLLRVLERVKLRLVKINEDEFVQSFKQELTESLLLKLSNKYTCDFIITRGKEAVLAVLNGVLMRQAVVALEKPLNTTACGDSFFAAVINDYLNNHSLTQTSLKRAAQAAAANAMSYRPGDISELMK